jgi:SagB-type dehydrogenase family enzyme
MKNTLATLVPTSPKFRFKSNCIQSQQRFVLSRFAYCHRIEDEWILESPLSHAVVILHDIRAIAVLFLLNQPQRVSDVSGKVPDLSKKDALLLFELLFNAGVLSTADENNEALSQWEFHDLLFHTRSRTGRHANPYGKTDRFVGKVKPPPILKPRMSGTKIRLYKPDIDRLCREDVPFIKVLEERCSKRKHGKSAITKTEVGEFLYRSARVRKVFKVNKFEFTNRIYPSSGAAYELELYLVINRCNGLASGLYHYSPLDHQLCRLSARTKAVDTLLKSAANTAHTKIPQILIIVSARFPRMMWRYQSIAYSAILKDVGVLYQTFYLVATAMGLSACALGVGNSDLFSDAAGTNYYEETSVGEFMLGR